MSLSKYTDRTSKIHFFSTKRIILRVGRLNIKIILEIKFYFCFCFMEYYSRGVSTSTNKKKSGLSVQRVNLTCNQSSVSFKLLWLRSNTSRNGTNFWNKNNANVKVTENAPYYISQAQKSSKFLRYKEPVKCVYLLILILCVRVTPKWVLLQTGKNQMKCSMMLHFIRIYTVC